MDSMEALDYYSFVKAMVEGASIVIDGGEYTYNIIDGLIEYTSYHSGRTQRMHFSLDDLHRFYVDNQETLHTDYKHSVRFV